MSSAVSYAYKVEQEELRRQRELQAARASVLTAERRHERLRQRALEERQIWGDSISQLEQLSAQVISDDVAELRDVSARLEQITTEGEKRLDDEVVAARISAFKEGLSDLDAGTSQPIAASAALDQARPPRSGKANGNDEVALEDTLTRLVSRLDPCADRKASDEVRAAAELVRASGTAGGREHALSALRLLVQQVNDRVRDGRARDLLLDRGEARLSGFDGPEATAARELIAEVRSGGRELPVDLEAFIDSSVDKESRAQEAEYVARELRNALKKLGYHVGPNFDTALLGEGYTEFTRSEWPGYAVRVRTGGHPPHLNFNVVRGDASRSDQAARDREVEEEFCHRQTEIVDQLTQAGISAERTRVVEPGERPIQIVASLEGDTPREASDSAVREMGK